MSDELLIKFLLRETSLEEDLLIKEWLAVSAENQKHFSDIEFIWNTSKNLAVDSKVDENEAWNKFKANISSQKSQTRLPLLLNNWLKLAAVLFIAAGAWMVYSIFNKTAYTTIVAKNVKTELLPDGSEITMNKNSELSYASDFKGKQRNVLLEKGEVFFKVSKNKSKPFVIKAGDVTVLVVGTSFNVKHLSQSTEVIVETGLVRVSRGNEQIELQKDEKILIEPNGKLTVKANTDELYSYYRSNKFVADNTPLWRVVEVLNEAYDSNIQIPDPATRNLTLTTTFKDETLEHILQIISDTFNIKVIHKGDRIILK